MSVTSRFTGFIVALLAGIAMALFGGRTQTGISLENAYLDSWHRAAGVRKIPSHVALVTIDEAALLEYGEDPIAFWTRHHAKAIANLRKAGVKAIGFDMLFAVSPEIWIKKVLGAENELSRRYDKAFRDEIHSGNVVLAGARIYQPGDAFDAFLLPHRDYLFSLPDLDFTRFVGLTNIGDGSEVIRSYSIKLPLRLKNEAERDNLPQFSLSSLLAAIAAGQDPRAATWTMAGKDYGADEMQRSIFFGGPPGAVLRVPYSATVKPGAANDPLVQSLRDKVVIIAAEIGGDQHSTPYSSGWFGQSGQFMSGPEIHANIVETLLSGEAPQPLSALTRYGIWLLAMVIAAVAFACLSVPWAMLFLVLVCVLTSTLAYMLFLENLLLPVAVLQSGFLASFASVVAWRGLAESRKLRRLRLLFSGRAADSLLEQLADTGVSPDFKGEYLPVTLLVCRLGDFGSISTALPPQDLVQALQHYHDEASRLIMAEGGTVERFSGDELRACFGAPMIQSDHAGRAMRSALVLKQAGTEFYSWLAERDPQLRGGKFCIGLHSGDAVAGMLGSRGNGQYTVVGDAVRIAARMAEFAELAGGGVYATGDTLLLASHEVETGESERLHFLGREIEVVPIKGRGKQRE